MNMRLPILATTVVPLAGCGGSNSGAAAPGGLAGEDLTITPTVESVYTVGSMGGAEWEAFGRIGGVDFDADGNLYILDSQAGQVVVVGTDGNLLRVIGKQGDGPGEFRFPSTMAIAGDGSLAVFDIAHRSFQLFDETGEFARDVPVDIERGMPGRDLDVHEESGLITSGGPRLMMRDQGMALDEPETRPVDRFSLDDGTKVVLYQAWDLPPAAGGDEQAMNVGGGNVMSFGGAKERAFEPEIHLGTFPDGRIALVDSIGYRIKLLTPEGELAGVLERPILPKTVTGAERDKERRRRLEEVAEGLGGMRVMVLGGSGSASIDEDAVREMREGRIRDMVFADAIPVIVGMEVDPEGRIWVERVGPDIGVDGPTDLISGEGDYLGTIGPDGVRIPDAFGPGGLVAYIRTDELDLQTVVVQRVVDLP